MPAQNDDSRRRYRDRHYIHSCAVQTLRFLRVHTQPDKQ